MAVEQLSCQVCNHDSKVTIKFAEDEFTFHSQWLHNARCDDGASRNAITAHCQQPVTPVTIVSAEIGDENKESTPDVTWADGISSRFLIHWLWVMAPIVALGERNGSDTTASPKGWTV